MMSRRFLPFLLTLLFITLPATAFGQDSRTPVVAIELSPTQAAQGDTVTAAVFIRNGVNIAGADIGIETDDCLKVLDRKQGPYLPDTSGGGFAVFDETTERSTRLAVAITDRKAVANEDDVFFHVAMEVVCAGGTAAVKVGHAELSAYKDPSAPQVELIGYTRDAGTLQVSYAELSIISGGIVRGAPAKRAADEPVAVETAANSAEPNVETPLNEAPPVAAGVAEDSAETSLTTAMITALATAATTITAAGALLYFRFIGRG